MRPSASDSQDRSVAERLDSVPLNMLRSQGESVPNAVREARAAHGKVLRRAAQIAGFESDKETAAALSYDPERPISKSQLSEWYAGTENPQTWRFEQHPQLGPALLAAMHEARGGVLEVRFSLPKVG